MKQRGTRSTALEMLGEVSILVAVATGLVDTGAHKGSIGVERMIFVAK